MVRQSNRKEAQVERRVCKRALDDLGVPNTKLAAGNGDPDRVFWIPGGRPLLIEFKDVVGKLSKRQEYIHGVYRTLGYDIQTHNSYEDAMRAIQEALARSQNTT